MTVAARRWRSRPAQYFVGCALAVTCGATCAQTEVNAPAPAATAPSGGTQVMPAHRPLFDLKFVLLPAPPVPRSSTPLPSIDQDPTSGIVLPSLTGNAILLNPVLQRPNVEICRNRQCDHAAQRP